MSSSSDPAREQRLQDVLLVYLQEIDAGRTPDRQELLRRHADLAVELAAFFADQDRLEQVAQRLRLCIESISLLHNGRVDAWSSIRLAISVGVVTASGPIESMDSLFRTCDEALYAAKASGRNTVVHRELRPEVEFSLPAITSASQVAELPAN